MLVGFDEEAVQFRDLVRDVLVKECSVERLRAEMEGAQRSRERWSGLAEVGASGCDDSRRVRRTRS